MAKHPGGAGCGILATIEHSDDEIDLVLFDAEQGAGAWHVLRLYTKKPYPRGAFAGLSLQAADYEEIGFNIVNRLCALTGLTSDEKPVPKKTPAKRRSRKQAK